MDATGTNQNVAIVKALEKKGKEIRGKIRSLEDNIKELPQDKIKSLENEVESVKRANKRYKGNMKRLGKEPRGLRGKIEGAGKDK
ncbi:hypothetical protein OQA88_10007 [Cercophora sp. LCS_1]